MDLKPRVFRVSTLAIIGFIMFVGLTILFYASVMNIERQIALPSTSPAVETDAAGKPIVRIGVVSRYPPTIMYRGYQPIMDYLTSQSEYRFELLLSQEYNESLEQLIQHKVAAVFLGSYLYIKAHERYGVIPILKPLNESHQPLSRLVLFVRDSSSIRAVRDLAGRKLALPSSESFSSHWILDHELVRNGIRQTELSGIKHFSHHHTVIAQIQNGSFDAGVTREYLIKDMLTSGLRAVSYSAAIPSSPIAVAADSDPHVVDAMRKALLAVSGESKRDVNLTKDWDGEFVYGFVDAADADYDVIRKVVGIK